jgi:hypothetical protein
VEEEITSPKPCDGLDGGEGHGFGGKGFHDLKSLYWISAVGKQREHAPPQLVTRCAVWSHLCYLRLLHPPSESRYT